MSGRYKFILAFTIIVGLGVVGWICFYLAPSITAYDIPDSISKLGKISKMGSPNGTLSDSNGAPVLISQVMGERGFDAQVVHFWASWCGPCIDEFPRLIKFARENPKILVIAISEDTVRSDADRFLRRNSSVPNNFRIYYDPSLKLAEDYGTEKLPESYIFCNSSQLLRKIGAAGNWESSEGEVFRSVCLNRARPN